MLVLLEGVRPYESVPKRDQKLLHNLRVRKVIPIDNDSHFLYNDVINI